MAVCVRSPFDDNDFLECDKFGKDCVEMLLTGAALKVNRRSDHDDTYGVDLSVKGYRSTIFQTLGLGEIYEALAEVGVKGKKFWTDEWTWPDINLEFRKGMYVSKCTRLLRPRPDIEEVRLELNRILRAKNGREFQYSVDPRPVVYFLCRKDGEQILSFPEGVVWQQARLILQSVTRKGVQAMEHFFKIPLDGALLWRKCPDGYCYEKLRVTPKKER
jgi:hypothetical protein